MSELPPQAPPRPEAAVVAAIGDLAKARTITRDQERIGVSAIQNKDLALLANRALFQGTDPEMLRRVLPKQVEAIAGSLGLSVEDAHAAIELAHTRGPGSLPKDSPQEWLWLILAKHSVVESDVADKSPEEVLLASSDMIQAFKGYSASLEGRDFEHEARGFREEMLAEIQPAGVAAQGEDIPLYTNDFGFYVAYRSGRDTAAVQDKGGLVFYGTDGSVTLTQKGIKVDKELSPFFGIVFPK